MRKFSLVAAAVLCCGIVSSQTAPEKQDSPDKAAFERLKALAGKWKGKVGENDIFFSYKVIAGGTTVVETLLDGTPYEMVSMYHMDGEALMMTHYCSYRNHPTYKFKSATKDTLEFDFVRGSNMKLTDPHMHEVSIKVDGDHLTSTWTSWVGGKATGKTVFSLERVK